MTNGALPVLSGIVRSHATHREVRRDDASKTRLLEMDLATEIVAVTFLAFCERACNVFAARNGSRIVHERDRMACDGVLRRKTRLTDEISNDKKQNNERNERADNDAGPFQNFLNHIDNGKLTIKKCDRRANIRH